MTRRTRLFLFATVLILAVAGCQPTTVEAPVEEEAAVEEEAQVAFPININTATADELELLPLIDSTIAAEIVAYRQENGDFPTVEAIQNVPGIGPAVFEEIRDLITVGTVQGTGSVVLVSFGGEVGITAGYSVVQDSTEIEDDSGERELRVILVCLEWVALQAPAANYSHLVSLLAPSGESLGRIWPNPELDPMSEWPIGSTRERCYDFTYDVEQGEVPPEVFEVWVEVYDQDTGERLPATALEAGMVDVKGAVLLFRYPGGQQVGGEGPEPVQQAIYAADSEGLVEVVLYDGSAATVQVSGPTGDPISEAELVAYSDAEGVTLIVVADGYHPRLSTFWADHSGTRPPGRAKPLPQGLITVHLDAEMDEDVLMEESNVHIDHLINLPRNVPGWELQRKRAEDLCMTLGGFPLTKHLVHLIKVGAKAGPQFVVSYSLEKGGEALCVQALAPSDMLGELTVISSEELGLAIVTFPGYEERGIEGIIYGQVVDAESWGVEGAQVSVEETGDSATTLSNGWYYIELQQTGRLSLSAEKGDLTAGPARVEVSPYHITYAPALELSSGGDTTATSPDCGDVGPKLFVDANSIPMGFMGYEWTGASWTAWDGETTINVLIDVEGREQMFGYPVVVFEMPPELGELVPGDSAIRAQQLFRQGEDEWDKALNQVAGLRFSSTHYVAMAFDNEAETQGFGGGMSGMQGYRVSLTFAEELSEQQIKYILVYVIAYGDGCRDVLRITPISPW